jgi:hypothetical protein
MKRSLGGFAALLVAIGSELGGRARLAGAESPGLHRRRTGTRRVAHLSSSMLDALGQETAVLSMWRGLSLLAAPIAIGPALDPLRAPARFERTLRLTVRAAEVRRMPVQIAASNEADLAAAFTRGGKVVSLSARPGRASVDAAPAAAWRSVPSLGVDRLAA